jgi:hypothetical protein
MSPSFNRGNKLLDPRRFAIVTVIRTLFLLAVDISQKLVTIPLLVVILSLRAGLDQPHDQSRDRLGFD